MLPAVGSMRRLILIVGLSLLALIIYITSFREPFQGPVETLGPKLTTSEAHDNALSKATLSGHAIAPKLGNETLKAELGRASWKLFHTMMAQFPDTPTLDEREALRTYVHLFQRLYPCGECAEHFGKILAKFPPQVSSRSAAAAWACHVHNEVNKDLHKAIFDCSKIGDFYDCGCAEDEKDTMNLLGSVKNSDTSQERIARLTGEEGAMVDADRGSGWRDSREV